jgi:hypothetical protein
VSSFLRTAECNQEALQSFKKAIELHNSTPAKLDLSKFPAKQGGFYKFTSAQQFLSALPHLCDSDHEAEINCFDCAILLSAGKLKTSLMPDSLSGPFLVGQPTTNGTILVTAAATPRDACALICPSWYLDAVSIPKSIADQRKCLKAVAFSAFVLPIGTSQDGLGSTLLSTLHAGWRRSGVEFPRDCDIVLCHWSDLRGCMAATRHAGVLSRRHGPFVYIEKAGVTGPFLRLDLEDIEDLTA